MRLTERMGAAAYIVSAMLLRVAGAGLGVALPLAALERLGDVGIGGLLTAAALAPGVVTAPFAGVALDRARRPNLLIAGSGLVTALGMAVAAGLGAVPLPVVAIALAAAGAVNPFFMGGLSSFATDAIRDERSAYAADAFSYNIGAVAGPAAVAGLVVVGSASTALLVLAGASAVGAIAVLPIRMSARTQEPVPVGRAIRDGIRWITRHRPLAVTTASGSLSTLAGGALPVFAVTIALDAHRPAGQAGWLVTAFAIGTMAGFSLTVLPAVRRLPPALLMGAGFAIAGVLIAVSALDLGFIATIVLLGAAGVPTAPAVSAMLLLRKQESPPAVRGQVFTIAAALRTVFPAAGAAVAAGLTGAPAPLLLLLLAVVWLASAAIMLGFPRSAQRREIGAQA
ncbi:MAG TPA: MFS transporter [Pseudolysinimonas sp.]|nr:MFS transporter [Pseudolysinimonas sp.]